MRLRWVSAALVDLTRIGEFVRERDPDPDLGHTIVEAIRVGVKRLRDFPESGPALPGNNLRKLSIPRYRYIVVYQIVGTEVRILRVRHAAENRQPR